MPPDLDDLINTLEEDGVEWTITADKNSAVMSLIDRIGEREGMRLAGATTGFLAWTFLSLEIRSAWKTAGRLPETREQILLPMGGKKK